MKQIFDSLLFFHHSSRRCGQSVYTIIEWLSLLISLHKNRKSPILALLGVSPGGLGRQWTSTIGVYRPLVKGRYPVHTLERGVPHTGVPKGAGEFSHWGMGHHSLRQKQFQLTAACSDSQKSMEGPDNGSCRGHTF